MLYVLKLEQVARTLDHEGCESCFAFGGAFASAEIGHGVVENIFRVFGASATRRSIERVNGLTIVRGDNSARFLDRSGRHRMFAGQSAINLRARRWQQVIPFSRELSPVSELVGAGRDCLG